MAFYTASLYHVFVFVIYTSTVVYEYLYVKQDPKEDPFDALFNYRGFGGKFKFLTWISFNFQTIYFGLSIINDIWGSNIIPSDTGKKRSRLQNIRDTYLASIVYPVGTFVVMTFWGIYAVDRELVFPKRLDAIIPPWLNHVVHTTILPVLLLEKYLVYHRYPSKRKGIPILLGFALAYLLWILWVAYYANFWVYPVLAVMEDHQRVIFITVLMAFFISIYIAGESINKILWRAQHKVEATKKIKSKNEMKSKKVKQKAH